MLEGTNLIKEAIKSSISFLEFIVTPEWIEKHNSLISLLPTELKISLVTSSVLQASVSTKNPDGVAALIALNDLPDKPSNPEFILVLDRIQDPGNVGNLFRTALASDVDLLLSASGADPLSQKVLRSSSGSILNLPFERVGDNEIESIDIIVKRLEKYYSDGFQIIGTSSPNKDFNDEGFKDAEPIPYWELNWDLPTVLVLGNEGSGLNIKIFNCCTHVVTLPHSSKVESLNVASAAVPILLERRRVKMSKVLKNKKNCE